MTASLPDASAAERCAPASPLATPPIFAELSPPYSTIVADPPWHYDAKVVAFDKRTPMPYSTMSNVCLGWGFEPSQVLTWCKPQDRVSPGGGLFFGTTEFVIYARRSHGGGERLVKRAGAMIREAREREGLSRGDLHRLIRGGNPTGIVHRWENDDCLPNDRDWVLLLEVLGIRHMFSKPTVPQRDRSESRVPTTWFQWPRGAHSAKPAAFLDIVERVSPGPYVELFARAPRLGWDSWGHGYEIGATA
jgi:hypothetical protein